MLAKSEATIMATQFTDTLADRVELWLRNQARLGRVGGVFAYTPEDTGPKAQAVRTALEANGWTVVVDTVAKTVTISQCYVL